MNVDNMNYEDFLNLYYFVKNKNKQIYLDYKDNFHPTLQDIENYNTKVDEFKKMWEKDKSIIHKPIAFERLKDNYKEDNDFAYCLEIGHKFELWVEDECKKYGVDLGMYYGDKQFSGENELGLEIKHDGKLEETGNVYIEYEALNKDESRFYESGILKKDNCKYWLIGTEKEFYIFYKEDLYRIYRNLIKGNNLAGCKLREKRTSKGFTISREKCKAIMIVNNIQDFLYKTGIL